MDINSYKVTHYVIRIMACIQIQVFKTPINQFLKLEFFLNLLKKFVFSNSNTSCFKQLKNTSFKY